MHEIQKRAPRWANALPGWSWCKWNDIRVFVLQQPWPFCNVVKDMATRQTLAAFLPHQQPTISAYTSQHAYTYVGAHTHRGTNARTHTYTLAQILPVIKAVDGTSQAFNVDAAKVVGSAFVD
jgi:hypothetical protein